MKNVLSHIGAPATLFLCAVLPIQAQEPARAHISFSLHSTPKASPPPAPKAAVAPKPAPKAAVAPPKTPPTATPKQAVPPAGTKPLAKGSVVTPAPTVTNTHTGPSAPKTKVAPTGPGTGPSAIGPNAKVGPSGTGTTTATNKNYSFGQRGPRPGETKITTRSGDEIYRGRNGQPTYIRARGYDIHRGPGGQTTFIRQRQGNVYVVSNSHGYGYVQRPYYYHGAEFYHRAYYVNGVAYGRYYRPYYWGGVPVAVYAPGYYYPRAFYGWAYYPWAAPVSYAWGWYGSPWYGYYGGWFTPYPVYTGPTMWLTDYLEAQTLQAAYQANAPEPSNIQANNFAATPLTPDVKLQIGDEVHRQLALEAAEAQAQTGDAQEAPDPGSSGIARMLSDNTGHIFVVSAALTVLSTAGDCSVTEGDVLRLSPGTPNDASVADLVVLANKGQDCPRGATVMVGIADLQEMQNHMRETIDQGLVDLQREQGKNGIPAAPAAALAPPVQAAFAAIAPPPDPNLQAELSQEAKDGTQAEKEVLAEAGNYTGPGGPNPGPDLGESGVVPDRHASGTPTKELSMGMTLVEVEALFGPPKNMAVLGTKKIYVYDIFKITFINDEVTDIQ